MWYKENQRLSFFWFIGFALLLIGMVIVCKGSAGGGDHYVHYRMAHFAPQHPHLFFDLWGKPLFTMLACAFAQAGTIGVEIMNALLATATSYLLFRFLYPKYGFDSIWASVFLLLMPAYFFLINSAMTEILFSFLLMLSVFLTGKEKIYAAALVVSLLPFSRQEGYFIIPVFAVYFLYCKNYKVIPLLFFGIVLFSLIGGFYFKDFLWLMHQHPYPSKEGVYGYGHPLHFILHSEDIVGVPMLFLIGLGLVIFFYQKQWQSTPVLQLLMYFIFAVFFSIHSYLWWQGKSGSMGLTRVMACVLPMLAPLCLDAWQVIVVSLKKRILQIVFKTLFVLYLVFFIVGVQKLPITYTSNEKAIIELCHWVKSQNLQERKWVSTEVWLWHFLKKDPYNKTQFQEGFAVAPDYFYGLSPGDMILWENQFGLFHLPLETLMKNPKLKLVAQFNPTQEVQFGKNEKLQFSVFEVVK